MAAITRWTLIAVAAIIVGGVCIRLERRHGPIDIRSRSGRLALFGRALASAAAPHIASLNWSDRRQTIDGFGGSCADFLRPLSSEQADFFFTTSGIGLSLLRTQIIPDALTCDKHFLKGACSESDGMMLNGELAVARQAAIRGVVIWSTPWSPPGAYKTNGTFNKGGSLLPIHYSDWAADIARYVTIMLRHGVAVFAVSVQNEPDLAVDYGSCLYTASQLHAFVPVLHAALRVAGVGSTKIMIAEQSLWRDDLAAETMMDPKVAGSIGIVAAHGYGSPLPEPLHTGRSRVWQTEDSGQSPIYDGGIADGLSWAEKIHHYLTNVGVNAWMGWFLSNMHGHGDGTDNSAMTDINGKYPKRAYVLGQWSRFVRPGWVRLGVTYPGEARISAFTDPAGRAFAIVAVNSAPWPVSVTFALQNWPKSSVTPWVTSATASLAAMPAVAVRNHNFGWTLPAESVTTFSSDTEK